MLNMEQNIPEPMMTHTLLTNILAMFSPYKQEFRNHDFCHLVHWFHDHVACNNEGAFVLVVIEY